MSSFTKKDIIDIIIIMVIASFITICITVLFMGIDNIFSNQKIENEQFGGVIPMKVYQIYDRDTGVYYAVTEKGGICVMQTINGEVKLVDQGDGAIYHPNKSANNNDAA